MPCLQHCFPREAYKASTLAARGHAKPHFAQVLSHNLCRQFVNQQFIARPAEHRLRLRLLRGYFGHGLLINLHVLPVAQRQQATSRLAPWLATEAFRLSPKILHFVYIDIFLLLLLMLQRFGIN